MISSLHVRMLLFLKTQIMEGMMCRLRFKEKPPPFIDPVGVWSDLEMWKFRFCFTRAN